MTYYNGDLNKLLINFYHFISALGYDISITGEGDDIKVICSGFSNDGKYGTGPPPTKFVEYFNEKYSKKGDATRKTWYPVVALLIETPDYGSIIIGFSIINKKFKLYNWQGLKNPDTNGRGK